MRLRIFPLNVLGMSVKNKNDPSLSTPSLGRLLIPIALLDQTHCCCLLAMEEFKSKFLSED